MVENGGGACNLTGAARKKISGFPCIFAPEYTFSPDSEKMPVRRGLLVFFSSTVRRCTVHVAAQDEYLFTNPNRLQFVTFSILQNCTIDFPIIYNDFAFLDQNTAFPRCMVLQNPRTIQHITQNSVHARA